MSLSKQERHAVAALSDTPAQHETLHVVTSSRNTDRYNVQGGKALGGERFFWVGSGGIIGASGDLEEESRTVSSLSDFPGT